MSTRNKDIKTYSGPITSNTSMTKTGQVPASMTRWITFFTLDTMLPTGASSVKLYFASVASASPTKASVVATGNRKLMISLRTSGVLRGQACAHPTGGAPLQMPSKIDTDKPLFCIASEKYLGVCASNTSANVFIQYYDE